MQVAGQSIQSLVYLFSSGPGEFSEVLLEGRSLLHAASANRGAVGASSHDRVSWSQGPDLAHAFAVAGLSGAGCPRARRHSLGLCLLNSIYIIMPPSLSMPCISGLRTYPLHRVYFGRAPRTFYPSVSRFPIPTVSNRYVSARVFPLPPTHPPTITL